MLEDIVQSLIFGLTTAGFLLVSAIGFTFVAKVEGFLNIAHAELISFGAFATWFLNVQLGWALVLAAIVAVLLTGALANILAEAIFRPIREYGPAILMITSVGAVFMIQAIVEVIVGTGTFRFDVHVPDNIHVGNFQIHPFRALIVVIAAATLLALHLFLTRTRTGTRIRAISIDRTLAANRGVSVEATSRVVWLITGLTAGLAGVSLGLIGTLTTDLAFKQILLIVAVAVFAGFRSLLSLGLAALLMGLAMDLSVVWLPTTYRTVIPFAIIIVILMVRPQGLQVGRA
jgi:branched-chain amino acid transport system permease protein